VALARAWRTDAGRIATANLLTLARLGLVVALPLLFARLPPAVFGALVLLILGFDAVDGWVARTRREATAFGAALDMETDALTVMVLALLLSSDGAAGPWVLAAGLWRYVFAAVVALVPSLGDTPPSPIYRWVFGAVMIAFAAAFVTAGAVPALFAGLGTALVSFSFLHALVRSRAFRRGPREAPRP
jgi:phosphatidylglycerophosphate synthase